MIKPFNQRQIIYGCLRISCAAIILWLFHILFMAFIGAYCQKHSIQLPDHLDSSLSISFLIIMIIIGLRRSQDGPGYYSLAESGIHAPDSESNVWNRRLATQDRRGNALFFHVFSNTLIAAPIQLRKAYNHFQRLVPNEHGLEIKLTTLLTTLQNIGKWHDFDAHPGHERELIFLINMGKVDYSPMKGKIRAK
jgi:hypothetical protein